jgi:hypothetical protein
MSYFHILFAFVVALSPVAARAHGPTDPASHGCARLRAEARSRAALLRSPSVRVQGLHLPGQGDTDGLGLAQQRGYQLRALLEWPLLDLYRAARVEGMAEGECSALAAQLDAEHTLAAGGDLGRLAAARALIAELEAHDATVRGVLREAERRRDEGVITAMELDVLRLLVLDLHDRRALAQEDIARLEMRPAPARTHAEVALALARHDAGQGASDLEASRLRRIDAFHLDVAGGVIPDREVDWFASISVSYDLGGLAQGKHEQRALAAGRAERREAEYELAGRLALMRKHIEARAAALRSSLEGLTLRRTMLAEQQARIERGESREAIEQRARIELELVANAAERAFASTLLRASEEFLESNHE